MFSNNPGKMASEAKLPNKPKKVVLFRHERLQLVCEWSSCRDAFRDMGEFLRHIKSHLASHPAGDLNCCWKECGYSAGSVQEFHIHVNFHGFHTKVKCLGGNLLARTGQKSCSLSFVNPNVIPELPDKLVCSWEECGEVFYNPEVYYRHVDQHVYDVPGEAAKCMWEGCEGQFYSCNKMRDHFRSHTQEKLIACQTCGGLYSNRTKFFDHVKRQIPTEDQQYQCSHCSKKLASERLLRDHMRNHINHYKCPFCDMTCSNPSNLSNHIKYRHTTERPFACNYCEYSGKTQADLCKHLRTHLSEPQHKCSYADCTFATRTENTLKTHVLKEHKKAKMSRYCCHMCEKTFARGTYLTRHLFTKHKFRWPSGHSRFRYKRNPDGTHQLQTIRYESIELTREMIDLVPRSENATEDTSMEEDEGLSSDPMCARDKDEINTDGASDPDLSALLLEVQSRGSQKVPANGDGSAENPILPWTLVPINQCATSCNAGFVNADNVPEESRKESCRTIVATFTGPDGVARQVRISIEEGMNVTSC